jgi:polypeptide N-acetylgalactosaminyltransferase
VYIFIACVFILGLVWFWQWDADSIAGIFDEVHRTRMKRFINYQKSESLRTGPGEKGEPVFLEGDEKKHAEELMPKEAFNRIASDKISLERSLPDVRDAA